MNVYTQLYFCIDMMKIITNIIRIFFWAMSQLLYYN